MKKNSSIKGLLLIFLILAIAGSLIIYFLTRENMTLMVFVYDNEGLVEGAVVGVDEQKKITGSDGAAEFHLLVDQGDTLNVDATFNENRVEEKYVIDSVRYFTEYGICDIWIQKE